MKDWLPDWLKNLPAHYLAFLVLAIGTVLGLAFFLIQAQQYTLACATGLIGLIVAGAFLYVLRRMDRSEGTARELRKLFEQYLKGQSDSWTRPMIQLPLLPNYRDRVLKVLDDAIDAAYHEIIAFKADFQKNQIRANVFLPNNTGIRDGDVCNLTIPKFGVHPAFQWIW